MEESDYLVKTSIDIVRPPIRDLMDLCAKRYSDGIDSKQWILQSLVIIGAALTLACYIIIIPIIWKVVRRKHETLGSFAFIPNEDIEKIIMSSQKVSIHDAKYNASLTEFREDLDDESHKSERPHHKHAQKSKFNKESSNTNEKNNEQPTQNNVTHDPILPTGEPIQAPQENTEQIEIENTIKNRMMHKKDYLSSGEYFFIFASFKKIVLL